ncbi:hypothetical protein NKG94_07235 [Micromonospora sp. M12]
MTRAVFAGVLFLTVVYAGVAWAMGVAVGTNQVAAVAADPDGGLPFSVLEQRLGGFLTPLAQMMLILAIVTSLLAFHNVVARYVFAMAREGVLPAGLARSGSGTGSAPHWRVAAPDRDRRGGGGRLRGTARRPGGHPVHLAVDAGRARAAVPAAGRLRRGDRRAERAAVRVGIGTSVLAPLCGVILGSVVLGAMVINVGSLLGAEPGSMSPTCYR